MSIPEFYVGTSSREDNVGIYTSDFWTVCQNTANLQSIASLPYMKTLLYILNIKIGRTLITDKSKKIFYFLPDTQEIMCQIYIMYQGSLFESHIKIEIKVMIYFSRKVLIFMVAQ
jgi:hypothetical protein